MICNCGGELYSEYGYSSEIINGIHFSKKLGIFDRCEKCYKVYNFVEDKDMDISNSLYDQDIIKVFKLTPTAKLPTKADGDMCYDIYSNEDKKVSFGEIVVVKTGIKICPPENHHYSVRPRSGLAAKNGIHIMAGQMDNTYRGEVLVCLTKLKNDSEYNIQKGDRIAQIKFEEDTTFPIEEVDSEEKLGYTIRGENGLGASGR